MNAILAVAAVSALAAGDWFGEKGNGNIRDEDRKVGAFSRVEVSGGIEADISLGSDRKVTLSADENLLPLIKTEVEGEVLKVFSRNVRPSKPIRVRIVTPKLEGVGASGGVKLRAEATQAKRFSIDASGGAEVDVRGIDAELLAMDLSGGVQAKLAGKAQRADLEMSGGVEIDAQALQLTSAKIDASGGVQGRLAVSEKLSGEASGGVSLAVKGRPALDVDQSGGSRIRTE